MKHISFMAQNKDIINFRVDGKVITYSDKIWRTGVQFIPKDREFIKKLICARNRLPASKYIIQWLNEANSGKNYDEWKNAKGEDEVCEIIRRDAKLKGLIEVKL